jgi:hypothetical protein
VTCIVGLVDDGVVYIGGDSAGVSNSWLSLHADRKVFTNGPYVMGFTSSFRMGQLLQYALKPPAPPERGLERFMVTTFVDAVRRCLKDGGLARKENEVESGGAFLVGVGGRLFEISADYQVKEEVAPYASVGSGSVTALGAMYATEGLLPRDRIRLALGAAARFSTYVRRPFTIRKGP